jgi:hypothetical protein
VPDVGHYPDWEKPVEFFAIVDRFLGGNRGSSQGGL